MFSPHTHHTATSHTPRSVVFPLSLLLSSPSLSLPLYVSHNPLRHPPPPLHAPSLPFQPPPLKKQSPGVSPFFSMSLLPLFLAFSKRRQAAAAAVGGGSSNPCFPLPQFHARRDRQSVPPRRPLFVVSRLLSSPLLIPPSLSTQHHLNITIIIPILSLSRIHAWGKGHWGGEPQS